MKQIKMNILIVSQYFWPESFQINNLAKSLVEKKIEVEVLTGKPNYPAGIFFDDYKFWGIKLDNYFGILVNRIPLLARGKGALRLALNYLSFVFFGLLCAPFILRKKKYDVIFVYGVSPILQAIPALFIGKLKKTPVIIWVQDLWPESLEATGYIKNKKILKAVSLIVRFIYRHADLLLVQSEAFVEPVQLLAGTTPVKYYPNSPDVNFASSSKISGTNISGFDKKFPILFAGNIGSAQAVEVIVETATILQKQQPDIHFIMLGDGSKRPWIKEQIQQRGLNNLDLPGKFPVETMPFFMQQASALLVTLADQDIFSKTVPNKIQSYLASGRPILASLNGEGARVITEAGAGLAVNANDVKGLARVCLELYNTSQEARNEMGKRGHNYYLEHYDHNQLIEDLIVHFESVAS
ncbi:MAG: glycosyltransferase family 4 protein [Rhodomicrobiaceae bacterium]